MATHQTLSGVSDEDFLQRMLTTYPERFGEAFWTFFIAHVLAHLPPRPVVVDLGCGPGLFLRDLGERSPQAILYGYDITSAMIAYGGQLPSTGARPTLALHDVATQPLPHEAGTVPLVTMTSVLHLFDEPLPVMSEVRRILAPNGLFVLNDWVRIPLQVYLARRTENPGEEPVVSRRRAFRLFPVHNKYTVEDWEWLLTEAGFAIRHQTQLRPTHQLFVATPAGGAQGR